MTANAGQRTTRPSLRWSGAAVVGMRLAYPQAEGC